jgi:hypothetical protein
MGVEFLVSTTCGTRVEREPELLIRDFGHSGEKNMCRFGECDGGHTTRQVYSIPVASSDRLLFGHFSPSDLGAGRASDAGPCPAACLAGDRTSRRRYLKGRGGTAGWLRADGAKAPSLRQGAGSSNGGRIAMRPYTALQRSLSRAAALRHRGQDNAGRAESQWRVGQLG